MSYRGAYGYGYGYGSLLESMSANKCTPCNNEGNNEGNNGGSGNKKKKNKKKNGAEEEEVVPVEDTMSPSDPNYQNIQTIREQRMVQRTTMLGTLKKEFASLFLTPVASFCEYNKANGSVLQEQCSALTYDNCGDTSCCVWAGVSPQMGKCTAGDANGMMYKTDASGNTINMDTYYYQTKCYGTQCSLAKMMKMKKMKESVSHQRV